MAGIRYSIMESSGGGGGAFTVDPLMRGFRNRRNRCGQASITGGEMADERRAMRQEVRKRMRQQEWKKSTLDKYFRQVVYGANPGEGVSSLLDARLSLSSAVAKPRIARPRGDKDGPLLQRLLGTA